MHDVASTCYPRAPRFSRLWKRKDAPAIAELVEYLRYEHNPHYLVLAGISDGATWIHHFAREAGGHVSALLHYAGMWRGVVADVPCLFVLGVDDRVGRRVSCLVGSPAKDTKEGAKAYGSRVLSVPGGHAWHADYNETMRSAVYGRLVQAREKRRGQAL